MINENELKEGLIEHLKGMIELSGSDAELIISKLEIKYLKKKEYLLQPGEISKHMRFISQGAMRVYYLDEKSQEHTLQLGIENWWINDLYSYLSLKPSKMYIQALEETIVIQISSGSLDKLFREVKEMPNFFRLKMQSAYVALQERTIENLSMDSYEKYSKFISQYRNIEQRFPQYIIASYLGMAPEFLSYLRKKHASRLK
ncbi:CRP-like cAMP-binding protein [Flavobacterium nitrogenifigens]|uniref:CRP-like cAMP-binding protein n=2 Tax=Flavobacterium TaxID=237 RepID=A0A7W7J2J0_9FLAO|nr:CRP-like cAMP-binding protein [Flavobacterium nitrogenifigens]MBB6389677.1 CRP-like cAMP-binding protein [Flavobacterium notoginsengisoli]